MRTSKPLMLAVGASVLAIFAAIAPVESSYATSIGLSGQHFELNILGNKTTNCPQTDGSGGNRIFVALDGISKILLAQGPFAVIDDNACTDGTASFQLPAPLTTTGTAAYTVWARVEGTPGGHGTLTTCGTDSTGATVCSTGMTISTRDLKNHFHDVTQLLTTVCSTPTTCVPIFSSPTTTYFWSYDNSGNKVLQLRFYPTS